MKRGNSTKKTVNNGKLKNINFEYSFFKKIILFKQAFDKKVLLLKAQNCFLKIGKNKLHASLCLFT